MASPQIRRLQQFHQLPVVTTDTVDAFLAAHETVVLFFSGDPVQHPEANDVAMVLPELTRVFMGRFEAALVEPAAQAALQQRFGFSEWPALVFLRSGGWLGTLTRMRDWADYLGEINALLLREPRSAAAFPVAVVAAPVHPHQE
ncbi:MAG: hypothetical protein WDA11_03475 [Thiohalomonadaceae bacterium]